MNATESLPEIDSLVARVSGGLSRGWRLPTRVVFRFFLVYFVLYTFPYSLEFIPGTAVWIDKYDNGWHKVIPWIGAKLSRVNITIFPGGSGDTTYNYVHVFVLFCIAAVGAIIWSVLARRSTNHRTL